MAQTDFSGFLAPWGIMDTRDPARACQHLSPIFRPHQILLNDKTSDFHFRHNRAELGDFSINTLSYGKEITIDAPDRPIDNYLVKFTLSGSSEVTQGRKSYRTSADSVCVLNPTCSLQDHMSSDFRMLIIQIKGENIRRMLSGETGISIRKPLEFSPCSLSAQGPATSLARLIKAVCEDLAEDNSGFKQRRVGQLIEQSITGLLLYEFPHNYSEYLTSDAKLPAPDCLQRVKEYIHEHLTELIMLEDLGRVAQTSIRSLQILFKKHIGTTPMAYLRDCRLELAHKRIQARDGATITDIALDCGFSHLGKFASYYQLRYGELPSQTFKNGKNQG
ncbi:MAG TPA: AraC family transcriptional regulator [Nitrosomonas sp.]|nr:AraC family transcriptional regulator [Halioglobus sp.]MCP5193791.1 AraC family transcriptional regulator [Pseudomonadales bacterium]HQU63367.1 AraC family transcriptional regulator [Nitrosomonas sp.]